MDAVDMALVALRLGLVLLLYAFLVAVLRAASRGLRDADDLEQLPSAGTPAARFEAAAAATGIRSLPSVPPGREGAATVVERSARPDRDGPRSRADWSLPVLRLVVRDGGATGLPQGDELVIRDEAAVGRADDSSLVLRDPTVSGAHARIARVENRWAVRDLGSTNGTFVNERRATDAVLLQEGDTVAFGNVRLEVREAA